MKLLIRCLILSLSLLYLCPSIQAQFIDVDVTHPYFHAIDRLEGSNVIQGHKQGDIKYFRPLQEINRVEALKILLLGSETSTKTTTDSSYPDVPKNAWFNSYVHAATDKKIVSGFPDGTFHPEALVTYAEFLKMLTLSFDIRINATNSSEKWYAPFINRARSLNIIGSDVSPSQPVTRGAAAEIIFRTQTVKENGYRSYIYSGDGLASYYNEGFAGRLTASGEIYDPFDLTAAHRTLPFDTLLKVSNDIGQSVIVRINDRGPYHKDRFLDLSQRAFESLAPISKGVLKVDFEVITKDGIATQPRVPETIREDLSHETKLPDVPEIIQNDIKEDRLKYDGDPSSSQLIISKDPVGKRSKTMFDETVTYLPRDFYKNITLRQTIPNIMLVGTVFEFSGTLTNRDRPKNATVFSHSKDGDRGEQIKFHGNVSGQNFNIPVTFFEPGEYLLGIVFDDETTSQVAEISVRPRTLHRTFPLTDEILNNQVQFDIIPTEQRAYVSWAHMPDRLAKLSFSQGTDIQKELIFEDGISEFGIPYTFFQDFSPRKNLAIDFYVANSEDQSLYNQTSKWKKAFYTNYKLVPGFEDLDPKKEKVIVTDFPRFRRNTEHFNVSGTIIDVEHTVLRDKAYITKPNGFVKEIPLISESKDKFSIRITPEEDGQHVFEVMDKSGEVLYNRAFYVSSNYILPVMPPNQIHVNNDSPASVRYWVNTLRSEHRRKALNRSIELDAFAQAYAERMAREDFVGHTDPQGNSFQDRIESSGIAGSEFGENVSFGTTLQLALDGLGSSGSHRKNALELKWTKLGAGAFQNVKGEWFVTQIFGR